MEVVYRTLEVLGHEVGPQVALVEGQNEKGVNAHEAEQESLGVFLLSWC